MTAKEIVEKLLWDENSVEWGEKAIKQFTRHIAKQAVRDSTESKIDEGFEHGRGHFSACMDILSRIKELTQGES